MPSNSDTPWYYKNTVATTSGATVTTIPKFDFTNIDNYAIGNSKAFNGHFIYNLYNTNRATNVSGATETSIVQERVRTSAFFAGRVFYSGLNAPKFGSSVFFSQIVEAKAQYGYCYQANDPTSEIAADLLPSDGGAIDLIDAGNVLKMVVMGKHLIVLCTNGVWAISGSSGIGFTAADYAVQKISGVHNISHTSLTIAEGTPYWWTLDGIYTIQTDPQTHELQVTSISDTTIKTFYQQTIPTESKRYARGAYDLFTRTIHWVYRSDTAQNFN